MQLRPREPRPRELRGIMFPKRFVHEPCFGVSGFKQTQVLQDFCVACDGQRTHHKPHGPDHSWANVEATNSFRGFAP